MSVETSLSFAFPALSFSSGQNKPSQIIFFYLIILCFARLFKKKNKLPFVLTLFCCSEIRRYLMNFESSDGLCFTEFVGKPKERTFYLSNLGEQLTPTKGKKTIEEGSN
jgi:hypothetical protein